MVVVGGPSNFIVNLSPNPWILGFEILDLDFGLDKRKNNQFFSHVGGGGLHYMEIFICLVDFYSISISLRYILHHFINVQFFNSLRVRGGLVAWVPSDFSVNQSLNLWNLELKYLDFGLWA